MEEWNPMQEDYQAEQNKINKTLYVGLKRTPDKFRNKEALTEVFSKYGKVVSVRFFLEKDFAFVSFRDVNSSREAIQDLHHEQPYSFHVDYSKTKEQDNRHPQRRDSDDEANARNAFKKKSSESPMKPGRESSSKWNNDDKDDDSDKFLSMAREKVECAICQRSSSFLCRYCKWMFCSDKCFLDIKHEKQNCRENLSNFDKPEPKSGQHNNKRFDDGPTRSSDSRPDYRKLQDDFPKSNDFRRDKSQQVDRYDKRENYNDRKSSEERSSRFSDSKPDYQSKSKAFEDRPSKFNDSKSDYQNKSRAYENGPSKFNNSKPDYQNKSKAFEDRPSKSFDSKPNFHNKSKAFEDEPSRFNDSKSDYHNKSRAFEDKPSRFNDSNPDYNKPKAFEERPSKFNDSKPDYQNKSRAFEDKPSRFNDSKPDYNKSKTFEDRPSKSNDSRPDYRNKSKTDEPSRFDGPKYGNRENDRSDSKQPEPERTGRNNFFREKLLGTKSKGAGQKSDEDPQASSQHMTESILSLCRVGEEIKAKFMEATNGWAVAVAVPVSRQNAYQDLCTDFCDICQKNNAPHDPEPGEVAAVKHETGWYRAVKGPRNNWMLLDDGTVVSDKEIKAVTECPVKYKSEPPFAVHLVDLHRSAASKMAMLRVEHKTKTELTVEVLDDEDRVLDTCLVKPWPWNIYQQLFDDKTPARREREKLTSEDSLYSQFKSDSMVYLIGHKLPNIVYLRLADSKTDEKYHHILNAAASEGMKAEKADRNVSSSTLSKNLVCLVRDDGRFFRCVVESSDGDKASVVYMDIVKQAKVPMSSLFVASNTLAELPRLLVKMKLAKVPVNENNLYPFKLVKYLNNLEGQLLKLQFNGPMEELKEVILILDHINQNVNNAVITIITPVWKNLEDKNMAYSDWTYILEDEFRHARLQNYEKMIIMENRFIEEKILVVMPLSRQVTMDVKWLNYEINELCGKYNKPYFPHDNEICAVMTKEGKWARAVCLEAEEENVAAVLVDNFGMVKCTFDQVRKLPAELAMQQPRLMQEVYLKGLPDRMPAELVDKLRSLFLVGHTLTDYQISYSRDGDTLVYMESLVDCLRADS